MKNDDDPLHKLQIRHFPCQKLSATLFSVTNRLNSPHDSLLEWCDKIVLFLFKILWDTSSWHDNWTEISGACTCLKLIEIGSWLEGYWFKPMTPPTPWRNEQVVFFLSHHLMLRCPWAKQLTTMRLSKMTLWLISRCLCAWQLIDVNVRYYVTVCQAWSEKACVCSVRLYFKK